MADELKSQSGGEKTPEQQLAELLRQSSSAPAPTRGMGVNLDFATRAALPRRRLNWLALGASLLALVLVMGTGYFVLTAVKVSLGEITLELNQDNVQLQVDAKSQGTVNAGYVLRLPAGEHRLIFNKDGFLQLEKMVTVTRNEKNLLSVQLLPIPTIERLVDHDVLYARLNRDGSEAVFWDPQDQMFKIIRTADKQTSNLFRGSLDGIQGVSWSAVSQAAIVQLAGQPRLTNMQDNREVRGRYIVLGERPEQGAANYAGVSSWLFDDSLKTANGWQPVRLTDSMRQVAFGANGSDIAYIYETADGEYSLVRALSNGEEWERVIVDMPNIGKAKLVWGPDDRYLLIEQAGKLLMADLLNKSINDMLPDRVMSSQYMISYDGRRLAYIAKVNEQLQLKVYDFLSGVSQVVTAAEQVTASTVFTWMETDKILLVAPNQTFVKVAVDSDDKLIIPFVGEETNLQIREMSYSPTGQLLMIMATNGIFVMKM